MIFMKTCYCLAIVLGAAAFGGCKPRDQQASGVAGALDQEEANIRILRDFPDDFKFIWNSPVSIGVQSPEIWMKEVLRGVLRDFDPKQFPIVLEKIRIGPDPQNVEFRMTQMRLSYHALELQNFDTVHGVAKLMEKKPVGSYVHLDRASLEFPIISPSCFATFSFALVDKNKNLAQVFDEFHEIGIQSATLKAKIIKLPINTNSNSYTINEEPNYDFYGRMNGEAWENIEDRCLQRDPDLEGRLREATQQAIVAALTKIEVRE